MRTKLKHPTDNLHSRVPGKPVDIGAIIADVIREQLSLDLPRTRSEPRPMVPVAYKAKQYGRPPVRQWYFARRRGGKR
jgi:hypothetical protein